MNDPAFRRYQHWADRRMEDLVRRMQTRLKGIKPDVALVTWTTNAGRFGHFLSIPRNMPARMNLLLDAPDQEFWLDETNRGTTIVPAFANAYIWATTNHRVAFSEPYILSHGNPYGKDSFPPHEILRRMMLALTYGAVAEHRRRPAAEPAGGALRLPGRGAEAQALADAQDARAVGRAGDERQHPQLLRPLGRAGRGAVHGQRASAPSARRSRSTCRSTVINDWNLNAGDLAQYKVLILPNTACLDDAQVAAVEQFVRRRRRAGREPRYVAVRRVRHPARRTSRWPTCSASTTAGLPRARRRRPEDLDVNFAKSIGPDYWEKRKNVFDFRQDAGSFLNQGKMKTYVGDRAGHVQGPGRAGRAAKRRERRSLGTLRGQDGAGAAELPGRRDAHATARAGSSTSRRGSTRRITSTPTLPAARARARDRLGRAGPAARSTSRRRCACIRP